MRHIELKVCKKCKGLYKWEYGGIVMTPNDFSDRGLCPKCRRISIFKKHYN